MTTDLRDDLKAAFQIELDQYPPMPPLRVDAMLAIARPQLKRPLRLEWLAVAAAILVTAAILLGLVANRMLASQNLPVGPPPVGVKVFYLVDPHDPSMVDAFDWSGRLRGSVRMPGKLDWANGPWASAAPDGSSFIYGPPDAARFLDRSGRLGADVAFGGLWSADSKGLCFIDRSNASGWQLKTESTSGQERLVATISQENAYVAYYAVLACSFGDDVAVVARSPISQVAEAGADYSDIWTFSLSSGAVVAHRHWDPVLHAELSVSPDGRYFAENLGAGSDAAISSVIEAVGGDQPSTKGPTGYWVAAFSGDDTRVVLWLSLNPALVENWRSGQVVWHLTDLSGAFGYLAEPGGSAFAISHGGQSVCPRPPCEWPPKPTASISIVEADGSVVDLPGRYVPLW